MNKSLIYIIGGILIAAVAVLAYLFWDQKQEMNEMVEQMTIEKEELQEEYEDLAIQFDGYQKLDIRNDSLQDLLSREQQRVQDLLEELRQTKASNARRIAELKKELATVRAVMKEYVRQIDSLNVTNERLTKENMQMRMENQQVKEANTQLSTINSQLTETVTRAAMLEVTSCTHLTLNKHDRKTRILSQVVKLQFDYTIAKNITCTPGIKDLYIRVINPGGTLLNYTEPAEGEEDTQTFAFENVLLPYSAFQQIEYAGEEFHGTCFCPLQAPLSQGDYSIEFFCDGNLIGSFPITIKK